MSKLSNKTIEKMFYVLWGVHIEVDAISTKDMITYYDRDYDVIDCISINDLLRYWNKYSPEAFESIGIDKESQLEYMML